jgi:hypothetical protein
VTVYKRTLKDLEGRDCGIIEILSRYTGRSEEIHDIQLSGIY